MKLHLRDLINLGVVVLLSAALIFGAGALFLGSLWENRTELHTILNDTSGLRQDFSVGLNGVVVGKVTATSLTDDGVRIDVELNPGVEIPANVVARVRRASPIGEQRLELSTTAEETDEVLDHGDRIVAAPDADARPLSAVVDVATDFLLALPRDELNSALHEVAAMFDESRQSLPRLVETIDEFSATILENEQDWRRLFDAAPGGMAAVTDLESQLTAAIADTAVVTELLADRRLDIVALLATGADFAEVTNALLREVDANLVCIADDLGGMITRLGDDETVAHLIEILEASAGWEEFADQVLADAPSVQLDGAPSTEIQAARIQAHFFGQPYPGSYDEILTPRPSQIGAACSTEAFGDGVGEVEVGELHSDFLAFGASVVDAPSAAEHRIPAEGEYDTDASAPARLAPAVADPDGPDPVAPPGGSSTSPPNDDNDGAPQPDDQPAGGQAGDGIADDLGDSTPIVFWLLVLVVLGSLARILLAGRRRRTAK